MFTAYYAHTVYMRFMTGVCIFGKISRGQKK